MQEAEDFVDALYAFAVSELRRLSDVTYSREGVEIVDARNHLFRSVTGKNTDEETGVYLLSDLCGMDDEMNTVPDRMRLWRIARNYWNM